MELGIFFSFSRSGWIAFLLAVFFGGFGLLWRHGGIEQKHLRRAAALALAGITVLFFALLFFGREARSRVPLSPEEQAISLRLFLAKAALYEITDHRLFGVGPGNFVPALSRYLDPSLPGWMYQPVHNLYLLVAAESGLLGLMVFLFLLGLLFRRALGDLLNYPLPGPASGVFCAFLFLGFFDHFFWSFEQGIATFWLTVGLMLAGTAAEPPRGVAEHSEEDRGREARSPTVPRRHPLASVWHAVCFLEPRGA